MPSVTSAISSFVLSIIGVFISLFNSIFAVFYAIFALGANLLSSISTVVRHFVQMVLELCQGVVGFITGRFISISCGYILTRKSVSQ